MKYLVLLCVILFSVRSTAQINNPFLFSSQDSSVSNKESFLIGLPDNSLLMFWADRNMDAIYSSKSIDNGLTWENAVEIISFSGQNPKDLNAVVLNSGRILLTYKNNTYRAMYSDNSGISWQGYTLPTFTIPPFRTRVARTSLSKLSDGTVCFVYSYSSYPDTIPHTGIYTMRSSDGIDWYDYQIVDSLGSNGNIVSAGANKDILIYETSDASNKDIVFRTSSDGGFSWSDKQILLSDSYDKLKPRAVKDNTNQLWLLYYRTDPTVFQSYYQNEIYYLTSTDQGVNWNSPQKFSDYSGDDDLLSVSIWNGLPIVSFISSRSFNIQNSFYQIYYGIPGVSIDTSAPPYLYDYLITPQFPEANEPITLRTLADDENALNFVQVIIDVNGNIDSLDMYDDGMHNDSLPGDNIYGIILENGFPNGVLLVYDFLLRDIDNNTAGFNGSFVSIPNFTYGNTYLFDVNKLKLPLTNNGILADVDVGGIKGLHFDESSVLFSGGFYLSGLHQNQVWSNAVSTSALIEDYLPGLVGSDSNDFRNSVYVIKSSDLAFSSSWINFNYAVELGADFYDGDGDGIYNPVDLNGNGTWDLNEDRPDFLGDVTAWSVFNDGVPSDQRRFNLVNPMGIEIQQTLFAIGDESNPVDNMIIIRYRIINKGTVSNQFDSVYFGIWDDPDIGDDNQAYNDDLAGSDSSLNIGYTYNDGDDESYGINPPTFATAILAGPVVYIPGETFIDVNGNNIYDEGIDNPLDTAAVNKGEILGIEYYPGAKNLGATSLVHFIQFEPLMDDPGNHLEARNFLLGRNRIGELIDPCTWQYGNVFDIPCNQVNPLFLYSGDPVMNIGWINTDPTDQRILTSCGPFTLEQNENVDIWAAYVVGRGINALESVTKVKEYSSNAKYFYESNFSRLPTNVEDNTNTPMNFSLSQNYPNPFNPSTTINYQLAEHSKVILKVFDILGREVTVLVNEEKAAGRYNIIFNASKLASGVYLFQLRAGEFSQTRKMILLK